MARLDTLHWFAWNPTNGHLGCTRYYLGMAMRQLGGTQHVPQLSDLSDATCEYGDNDIDTVVIEHTFGFWKEHKLTINYPTYPRDNYEWSSAKFREWRATRDPCFIIDLSLSDPLDPRLLVDRLRDYTLEFEVRVESTLRDLRECLAKAIRDRDCYKEAFTAIIEDFDEMGMTNELSSLHFEQSSHEGVRSL